MPDAHHEPIDEALRQRLIQAQRGEITEYEVYTRLSRREPDARHREVLRRIADDERRHYDFWAEYTGVRPAPRMAVIHAYVWLARLLGLTFAIKLMEKNEQGAQLNYGQVAESIPDAFDVQREEHEHEDALIALIDEERLRYIGSVVLGLNDALVELTGALAGFTLALQDGRLVAIIGLITGIAAALSMSASEYLSTRTEADGNTSPAKAALYTGFAYILTVAVLIAPYLLLASPFLALACSVAGALLIILAFTYYISVARDLPFWPRFAEMAGISLGVAAVSFGIGYLLRAFVGVEM